MFDFARLRCVAIHEFHIERGLGRLAGVLFCVPALVRPLATVHHLQPTAAADPLRVADDCAAGVPMPHQIGKQLLDADQAQLPGPLRGRRRVSHRAGDRQLNGDRRLLVKPVLEPVVDVPGGRLPLDPTGQLGLGAADGDGAL